MVMTCTSPSSFPSRLAPASGTFHSKSCPTTFPSTPRHCREEERRRSELFLEFKRDSPWKREGAGRTPALVTSPREKRSGNIAFPGTRWRGFSKNQTRSRAPRRSDSEATLEAAQPSPCPRPEATGAEREGSQGRRRGGRSPHSEAPVRTRGGGCGGKICGPDFGGEPGVCRPSLSGSRSDVPHPVA